MNQPDITEAPGAAPAAPGASTSGTDRGAAPDGPSRVGDVDLTDKDAVRSALLERRWRQGAVLPADSELVAAVQMGPFATVRPDGEGNRIIVVSQDCDAVQGDCALEPGVEVVVATPLDRVAKQHQQLRDPRLLHLELRGSGGQRFPVAITPWAKGAVARPTLLRHEPDPAVWVRDADVQDIADFLARRYDRDAFPEEFVRRFGAGMDKLRALFRAHQDSILQIYMKVTPSEELAPFVPGLDPEDDVQPRYEATVAVLVSDALLDNKAGLAAMKDSKVPELKRALRKACPGVDVDDVIIYGWDTLTVKRAQGLRRVDLAAERSVSAGRRADQAEVTDARSASGVGSQAPREGGPG